MLLVITGSIKVSEETLYVKVRDEKERLDSYIKTIKWALEDTDFTDVIFCENSNYDLESVSELIDLDDCETSSQS